MDVDNPVIKVEFNDDKSAHTTRVEHDTPIANLDHIPVASFLDVPLTTKSTEYIQQLMDHVYEDKPDATTGDIFQFIKNLESRLGAPNRGENRLLRVMRYIKLSNKVREAEKQRDALLR